MTNEELLVMKEALMELSEQESESAKFSFVLGNALIQLDPHFRAVEEAQRAIYAKYAMRDEDGQLVKNGDFLIFTDEEALRRDLADLMSVRIEVPALVKLSLADFDAAKVKTKGKHMAMLKPLIAD